MHLLGKFGQRYLLALGLSFCLALQLAFNVLDLFSAVWAVVAIWCAVWIAHQRAHIRELRRSLNLANIRAARRVPIMGTPPTFTPIQRRDEGY